MSGAEAIVIPLVAISCICATIFSLYYLRNKENMALIEKGINPRHPSPQEPHSFQSLKYGLLFAGGGLGLLIAFLIERAIAKVYVESVPFTGDNGEVLTQTIRQREDLPELYFALIILGAGVGLVVAYVMRRRAEIR